MTVAVLAAFRPKPEHAAEVERMLRGMAASSRAEPGCRRYDLYRDPAGEGLQLVELYDDPAAVEAHRASAHYKAYRARIGELLDAPIAVSLLEPLDVRP